MTDDNGISVQSEDTEKLITDWLASLLEQPSVSPDDNFLDLGGHSKLAVELDHQVTEHFGVALDMQLLFEEAIAETISDIARRSTNQEKERM